MSILSVQDLAVYVPDLDVDSPTSAILKAQMLAEGPRGSKRPLEKREFTETPRASKDGVIRLTRWPIDPDSPITVQVRGSKTSVESQSTEWRTIPAEQYSVDVELCEITVESLSGFTGSTFSMYGGVSWGHGYAGRPTRRRNTQGNYPFQVRVTYTAGFDFQADPLDPEAEGIKTALAAVLELQSSSMASGVKQFNVADFMSGTTGADIAQLTASTQSGTLMGDYLEVFKQYCPKEYAT